MRRRSRATRPTPPATARSPACCCGSWPRRVTMRRSPPGCAATRRRRRTGSASGLCSGRPTTRVRRLIGEWGRNPPGLWFTYHLFHKAPDLIGPPACRAAGLPYLVAEASFAPKRATGPWAGGHEPVRDAIGLADHVFFLNPDDEACVLPLLKPRATSSRLPPVVCIQETHEPARRRAKSGAGWRPNGLFRRTRSGPLRSA